jgi:hypothetical protein
MFVVDGPVYNNAELPAIVDVNRVDGYCGDVYFTEYQTTGHATLFCAKQSVTGGPK